MLVVKYVIKTGYQSTALPSLIQKPDCGYDFTDMSVKFQEQDNGLSLGKVNEAITLDAEKKEVKVKTNEPSFAGKTVKGTITVNWEKAEQMQATTLQLTVIFQKFEI